MTIYRHDGKPYTGSPDDLVVTKLRGGWIRKAHLASKTRWENGPRPSVGDVVAWRLALPGDAVE